jgi:6-phosphogluconolactonase (cycloisomerase 2 family)
MSCSPRALALLTLAACSVRPVALTTGADAASPDQDGPAEAAAEPPDAQGLEASVVVELGPPDAADAPMVLDAVGDLGPVDRRIPPDLLPDPIDPDPDAAPPDAAPDLALIGDPAPASPDTSPDLPAVMPDRAPESSLPPPHSHELVFVANQDSDDISVFSVDAVTGAHATVSGSPFPTDERPYGLTITPDGAFLYAAHYGSENIRGFRVAADGRLAALASAPVPMPHPQILAMSATGKALYATGVDGLLYGFSVDSGSGALHAISGSPFAGVHEVQGLAADPRGRFLAVTTLNDPSGAGTVRLFTMDASGALQPATQIATPGLLHGDSPALAFDPSGAALYGAITVSGGADKVFGLAVPAAGVLTPIAGSPWSVSAEGHTIAFHPTRPLVYFASTSDVHVFSRAADGSLTAVAGSPALFNNDTGAALSSNGTFLYVLFQTDNEVTVSQIAESGLPAPFAGSPWKPGSNPWRIVVWAPPVL